MHKPLKYALSRALNGLRVKHDVESGAPFTGERNLSMDIVVRAGALTNASSPENCSKGTLFDVTQSDPQAQVYLRNGSATNDGTAAQPPRRESISTATLVRDTCPSTSAATVNLPP